MKLVRTVTARTSGLADAWTGRLDGSFQHLAPTGGVDGQHRDAELAGRVYGGGDGVGDVVELQVEKDFTAGSDKVADHLRPLGGEELLANFVGAGGVAYRLDDALGVGGAGNVQRHDEPVFVVGVSIGSQFNLQIPELLRV